VLRRIFGPKGNEAMGEWRKLHNEELRDLYSSSRIIRMIKSTNRFKASCGFWNKTYKLNLKN
jgi:hypothetical protein